MQIMILMKVVEICLSGFSKFVWNSPLGSTVVCEALAKRRQVMGRRHAPINCFCGREGFFFFISEGHVSSYLKLYFCFPEGTDNDKARINSFHFFPLVSSAFSMHKHTYGHIYKYVCMHVCIFMQRERERKKEYVWHIWTHSAHHYTQHSASTSFILWAVTWFHATSPVCTLAVLKDLLRT